MDKTAKKLYSIRMSEKNTLERPAGETPDTVEVEGEHKEALEYFGRHRDYFDHYNRGKVKARPAPPGLNTFACDLRTNEVYINSVFLRKKGLSEEKTAFAILHEFEHLDEKHDLLKEKGGAEAFVEYLAQIKSSKAFSIMDNHVSDIRQNRAVISRTNEGQRDIEQSLYRENLFSETDFTETPMHLQLTQALLRESRVPDEACTISPEVREEIDTLKKIASADGTKLLDILTHPDTPMSVRLKLREKYIWPVVQKLLKKDIEQEKQKQEGKERQEGESGDKEQNETGKPQEGDSGGEDQSQDAEPDKEDDSDEGKTGKPKPGSGQPSRKSQTEQPVDPNELFKAAYEKAKDNMIEAVPVEELEKALEKWKKTPHESDAEKANRHQAEKLGVSAEDLNKYRTAVEELEKTINPETNENAIEAVVNIFRRIVSKRLKPTPAPRYPVEDGEDLVDPAELYAEVKRGNLEPKVWETYEIEQKPGQLVGEVEITQVGDGSGSMNEKGGAKRREQRKTMVLGMEGLSRAGEEVYSEETNLLKPLKIKSEIYKFEADSVKDITPLKPMSEELGEKERIDVATAFESTPGDDTTDYITLEHILATLGDETESKIKSGELKKIVIVYTDGDSGAVPRVKNAVLALRQKGVVVAGVGITNDGISAKTTYAPGAKVAEKAEDLPKVLAELLAEHLHDL